MCSSLRRKHCEKFSRHRDETAMVMKGKWCPWFVGFSAFLCYMNSLECDLVFDDQPAIRGNMDLRPKTPMSNLFYNDFWGTPMHREDSHKSYRPLCVLTFRLNYWLHEAQPFGYHLANVILHVAVCLLFHNLCSKFLPYPSRLIAALLFAVHPIHTEAVTGVVGRAELLSAIFFLLALQMYINLVRQNGTNDYKSLMCCLTLSGLAMMSKEQGITVVAVCAAYDIFLIPKVVGPSTLPKSAPRRKVRGPTPTWRKDLVLRLLVMGTGTAILLLVRMRVMGGKMPVFNRFDNPASLEVWPTRPLTHHFLVSLNAWLLLHPRNLCCDWTMGTVPLIHSFLDTRIFCIVICYTIICLLIWKLYHKMEGANPSSILLGVSLCLFPFLPATNLFYSVGFVIAERVLYIPSMGYCLLVACGWHRLVTHYRQKRYILDACIVILLCLNTIKTIHRNFDWKDEESLFGSGLRFTQNNAKLYNNLGHVMESSGRNEEALLLFLQAANVQPDDLGSHLNVGRMYNRLGMAEKAERAFWEAKNLLPKVQPGKSYQAHIVPKHLDIFLDLGNLLSKNLSRLEEAQELYKEAISMKADYIDAYIQRASVLLKLNRSKEANDMYKEALKYDQMNPDILYNMGVLLLEQGKSHQAIARFDEALRLNPEHEKSLMNYAILSQDSGDSTLRRLANERLQVLLGKGSQPERTYFNLGMLAMQENDTSTAEKHFKKALQFREDFESALFNLALLLHEEGRQMEAVSFLQRLKRSAGGRHIKGLLLLGNIFFTHLTNYTAAQLCYELILENDQHHLPALHNLCAVLFQRGQLDLAESCFSRAKKLAPNNLYIEQHLGLVKKKKDQSESVKHEHLASETTSTCTDSNNVSCRLDAKSKDNHNKLSLS